jgi:Fe-S cluster assembly protein SufD
MSTIVLQNLDEVPESEYFVKKDEILTVAMYASGTQSIEGAVSVHLVGVNATANILGAFINFADNRITLHTLQHHKARGTTSNLLVKSVLFDTSTFSYDGAIRVENTGQKTDAYQKNENLLLSAHAHAQSKPSLEILADDVRCTHGATIGSIEREQLLYLQTRGISRHSGIYLIVQGFLDHVIEKISDTMKAKKVRALLWQHLSKQLQ